MCARQGVVRIDNSHLETQQMCGKPQSRFSALQGLICASSPQAIEHFLAPLVSNALGLAESGTQRAMEGLTPVELVRVRFCEYEGSPLNFVTRTV